MTHKFYKLRRTFFPLGIIAVFFFIIYLTYNIWINSSLMSENNYLMNTKIHEKLSEIDNVGRRPAILLLHGFGGSPLDLKPLSEALLKGGYAFKSIDLPGHGTKPDDLKDIKMQDWLDKSFSAYEALEKEYGEVWVIGFSMGGAVGLVLAAEKNVNKLVVISPYFKVKEQWYYFGSPENWAQKLHKIIPFVKKPKIGQINDPEGLRKYIAYRHIPTKVIRELSELGNLAKDEAKKVTCDTLWIHSKGDIVADFELSRETFRSLPSKNKYFIEYLNSNHVLLYDYDANDAINKIMLFLKSDFK